MMMMDSVAGRLWSRRGWLRRPVGHHVRRLSLTRRLGRKSRDDNASQASLVTADGGRYGGCVPLPPSRGGWVPQPPLPAGTASVTIQSYATELRGEPAFSLTSGVPHSPQAEPRRPAETVP